MTQARTSNGNTGGSGLVSQEQLLSEILKELQALRETAQRVNPERLQWGIFPATNAYEPMPPGMTVVNFATGKVESPDKVRDFSKDVLFLKRIQSLTIVVDSLVTVTVEPGIGKFSTWVNVPVYGSAREVERIILEADAPYNLVIIVGNSLDAPRPDLLMSVQARYSDTTLTKLAAAGTADSFTSFNFVPRVGSTVLDQTLYGKPYVYSGVLGQKIFATRNLGVVTAEVRVQGGVWPHVVLGLEALSQAGYILDPDIHVVGGASESYVSIPSGSQAILETAMPYGIIRLQGRAAAANPATAAARLVVEYIGSSGGMR